MALDHRAAGRDRHLLILRRERVAAELKLQTSRARRSARARAKAPRRLATMDFRRRDWNVLVGLGYGGQVEDLPFVGLARTKAGQVVHVDALHDDDDRARALVVQTGQQSIGEPLVGGRPPDLRQGVVGLQGIVDDDDVAAATGQCAADRRRQPEPARGEFDLGFGVLVWPDPRAGEDRPIPGRLEHGAEVVGMLFGEFGGIADADDAARRVASENERGESDRRGYRFERPRRHIDDQSRDLAAANPLELISDRLNVPRPLIVWPGTEGREDLVDEGAEVVAQQGPRTCGRQSSSPSSSLIGPVRRVLWQGALGSSRYCARIA